MIVRLRPAHSPADIARIYSRPHDHRRYGRGHGERVDETIRVGRTAVGVGTVADLSCGNAAIARALCKSPVLGDLAPGYPIVGPIEETIKDIEPVDLFVLSETLEHLDDPAAVLRDVRARCRRLLLSTPVDNDGDTNDEHYWSWSGRDVEDMLEAAGFSVTHRSLVDSRTYGEAYCYGIWLCSSGM